ncbi:MetQ/NlpA family ABC transporter substrate-binding protein [Lachnoanaerobaculum umeaense]|uniref:Lipoprotein n=1 Tax=Lachnoanaerobaculum umeaense TaxID=617123 RepID=A0A385Q2L9_9FIRM|nr:MetQ/NlpA family ABC transporter substrate-binding protein [Lachnoanaerobaculum umeaense]AYB00611.1 MetQ/NlpA family ABC transporter substrate-binding protein [Lachnoanaerobaculum umeaense]PZW91982.1 D-methionine transport system substrate-binding protein [Lachnoanaerobaculum umeaense]
MRKLSKLLAVGAILALGLTACGSSQKADTNTATGDNASGTAGESTKAEGSTTIKLGVVGENNEQWTPVIEAMAKDGITLELVKFADYSLPNRALNDGEIDLNAFQHKAYLANDIKDNGYKIEAIGDTIIAPLGVYSKKITDLSELKDGDTIAIPSDATNGGRALKVLESAGVIKVNPEAGYTPTLSDITENPKNIKFTEVEAANTPSLLPDVAAAVINGGHAVDNGLNPEKDSIYLEKTEDGADNPYVNIIVARIEDKDNENYQKVVKAFQSDDVKKVIEDTYKGAYIPAWK